MSAPRPKIAILSFSGLARDARVLRQVRCLAPDYDVHLLGYGAVPADVLHGATLHVLPDPEAFVPRNLKAIPKLALGRIAPRIGYERWYWDRADFAAALVQLGAIKPELILANDWDALPAGARAAERTGAPLVLDLHEYSPRQFDNRKVWMALIAPMIVDALRRYGPRVSRFMTVNATIAERYEREFGFHPVVVMNIPELGTAPDFHATAADRIRLIHHGAATRERRLEGMIEALAASDGRYELTFMLVDGNKPYVDELRAIAQRIAPGRVHFLPATTPQQIVETIAQYDVGIYVLPPVNSNSAAALPNKFFDFITAGLALCIGPTLEMARLTRQYQCGVVGDSFEPAEIARVLRQLSAADIDAMKRASIAARAELSSEHELAKVRQLVAQALA